MFARVLRSDGVDDPAGREGARSGWAGLAGFESVGVVGDALRENSWPAFAVDGTVHATGSAAQTGMSRVDDGVDVLLRDVPEDGDDVGHGPHPLVKPRGPGVGTNKLSPLPREITGTCQQLLRPPGRTGRSCGGFPAVHGLDARRSQKSPPSWRIGADDSVLRCWGVFSCPRWRPSIGGESSSIAGALTRLTPPARTCSPTRSQTVTRSARRHSRPGNDPYVLNAEIWATIRRAEPHSRAFWKVKLTCGHHTHGVHSHRLVALGRLGVVGTTESESTAPQVHNFGAC